jgi:hypothetical protein
MAAAFLDKLQEEKASIIFANVKMASLEVNASSKAFNLKMRKSCHQLSTTRNTNIST